jgi:predicted DNA binding CopG/RHH family protein
VQVIGEKVKRFMSKRIQYSDEPIGEIKLIADFLPSPEELLLKNKNTKITITLSAESVDYFKETAKKHHMQYQRIIRQLLDEYVAHQKRANKANSTDAKKRRG